MASEQAEYSSRFTFCWEYILISGLLATGATFIAVDLAALKPEKYSQLIVGNITWNQGLKQPDYVLLFSLIASFLLLYIGFYALSRYVRKANGESAEFALRQLLIYCALPCGILLGKILVKYQDVDPAVAVELLLGSLLLILLAIGFALLFAFRRSAEIDYQEYSESIGGSLLYVFFSLFIGSALLLAVGRVHLPWQLAATKQAEWISGIGAILLWIPLLKIWLEPLADFQHLRSKLRFLLWGVQAFLPLFFWVLLPTPWAVGKDKLYGYSFTSALPILTVMAIVIAYIDWLRRFRSPFRLDLEQKHSCFSAISPASLVALLLYLKAATIGAGAISVDDYHWGEFLLPWWLFKNFGYIPFWDYEPARGLVNYTIGLFANLFFDNTAASYQAVSLGSNALLMLPYLSIIFLTLSGTIGSMPAFLACLLMPMADGISEVDCMTTAALCFLGNTFFDRRWSRWLLVWGITSAVLLLFAPGQGGLLILSTSPIAGVATFQAVRKERHKLIGVTAVAGFIFLLLCLLTPLGKMLVGAVRYGVEQSSINSVAHGISWSASVDSNPVLSYWLWEVIRIAWIPVGMASGLLVFRAFVDKAWVGRDRYAVFGIPILLLTVLFIPRAAGRIDPAGFSRLGLASTWAVCLLLPIVLIIAYGQSRKAASLFVVACLGGVLVGVPVPSSILGKPTQAIAVESLQNGDRPGFPALAHTQIEPNQFGRLQAIKEVLSVVVDPGETYLDLTNHNADYFYLGYPTPIQSGAFYNLAHRSQQIRAIQKLEADPPPIVLVSSDNLLFDGVPLSLRSHLLYRYVVENYIPVAVSKFIYLVRPDRLQRLNPLLPKLEEADSTIASLDEMRLSLLDQAFRLENLQKIPSSWGASFDALRSELQVVKVVEQTARARRHALRETSPGTFQITGNDPFVVFKVANLELDGRDAGVLAFDFSWDSDAPANLEIYWGSGSKGAASEKTVVRFAARSGKVVVPLDASPRWLLAKRIRTIRFDVAEPAPANFSISNITLFQRSEVEKP